MEKLRKSMRCNVKTTIGESNKINMSTVNKNGKQPHVNGAESVVKRGSRNLNSGTKVNIQKKTYKKVATELNGSSLHSEGPLPKRSRCIKPEPNMKSGADSPEKSELNNVKINLQQIHSENASTDLNGTDNINTEPIIDTSEEAVINDTCLHSEGSLLLLKKAPEVMISLETIIKAVSATYKVLQCSTKGKKKLLDEGRVIFLQLDSVKVPKCPPRLVNIIIPHSLMTEGQDVCLFVKDLKRGRKQNPESSVVHYENMLREHNVTKVTSVIPLNMLKTEYGQFELKRKLLTLYDHFLVDTIISGHVNHILGTIFQKARKLPIGVRMGCTSLKHEIDKGLKKTSISINKNGNTTVVEVGHTDMPQEHVAENISKVIDWIASNYPGGMNNIRALHLKGSKSTVIPLYVTLKSRNTVNIPVVVSNKMSSFHKVEGELSTVPGTIVKFTDNGNVILKKDETISEDNDMVVDLDYFNNIPISYDKKKELCTKNTKLKVRVLDDEERPVEDNNDSDDGTGNISEEED